MKKRNITIKDIALALNVSKSTVSRALCNAHDINTDTKEKILEYARNHNYTPDYLAQSLRRRQTKTIGVIIPSYTIPFYSIAISGIQDMARQMGYNVMICQSNEQYKIEIQNLETLMAANVEGIIISVASDTIKNNHLRQLKQKKIPLVLFNRVIENFATNKVVVDDYYASKKMVEYLISRKCKNIAYLGGPENILLSRNRKAGYIDALSGANIKINKDLIFEGEFNMQSGIKNTIELLSKKIPFDCIFAICDTVAFGVIKELKKQGISIPKQVSVAGFTDEPTSELIEPSLTSIKQPIYDIGKRAAEILFKQIKDPHWPAEMCILDTDIIIRQSTR